MHSKDHPSGPWFEDCPVEDVLRSQREERAGKSREGEVSGYEDSMGKRL